MFKKIKKLLQTRKAHFTISLIGGLTFFFVLNGIINFIVANFFSLIGNEAMVTSFFTLMTEFEQLSSLSYLFLGIVSVLAFGLLLYKLRTNFKELEEEHSKGSSRFTTLDEIKKQYRSVPEKTKPYSGEGGVPISRYKDKIFIDDSPVNNLWVGTTRSGKGEMGMFPMIDVYSRAENKASMVVNDAKGELFAASKSTLEKRGYHVEVLNLDDPLQSMSYQVLQVVVDAYEEGNMSKAEQHAKTISSMLYADPQAKDKFWQDSASALCTALILGLCEKNIPDHKEKVTMYTVATTLNELASEKEEDEKTGDLHTGLDTFFESLPEHHPAKLQYATVKFASGAGQTVAGIFANAFDKLSIFTLTPIAKMTARNSFDMKKIGFGKSISGKAKPLTRIDVSFPDKNVNSVRSDANGLFKIYHDNELNIGDEIILRERDSDISESIIVEEIIEENGNVLFKYKDNDSKITINKFEHFRKPTALFMITPDYDTSLHIIASLYIKQLYTELSRTATITSRKECIRRVVFILDEFGNMPAIQEMGSIVTVALGRGMRFNLVIQSYSQLELKYDKDWKTIEGNCANTIYILTTSTDTAEEISKKIGDKTITSQSRSGGVISFNKNKTEGTDGRRLLNVNELMQLKEGETVVIRGIKRQDKDRKKITAFPIYNYGKSQMKYRYEYLAENFDTSLSVNDMDISCDHADLPLEQLRYRFTDEEDRKAETPLLEDLEFDLNQSLDGGLKQQEITGESKIGEILEGDSILKLITTKLQSTTEQTEDEILDMKLVDFESLLNELVKSNQLKANTVNVVLEKLDLIKNEEREEREHEELPM
ncbi:type IV secretory system conjugative DNA transfer family protein [Shouchella sp. 1P09AA]|uniref:VirD4-like conjugal transfer protein, CD1115 family n=1 Tax=unclassified Shouchella TaxID=2893065 RepID=UPI0039A11880